MSKRLLVGILVLISVVQVYSQTGNALSLSSSENTYLEIPTATFGGALTIEAWISTKGTTGSTGGPIVYFSNIRWGSTLYDVIELGVQKNNDSLYLDLTNSKNTIGGTVTRISGQLPSDWLSGSWVHVAATISLAGDVLLYALPSSTLQLVTVYKASASAAAVVVPAWTSRTNNFVGHNGDGDTFDGQMDDLRIFTEVRTTAQLTGAAISDPSSEPQLVIDYTFDASTLLGTTVVNQADTNKCNPTPLNAVLTLASSRKRSAIKWVNDAAPEGRATCHAWGDVHFIIDPTAGSNHDYQGKGCHWFFNKDDIVIQSYDLNCVGNGFNYNGAACQAGYAFLIYGDTFVFRMDWVSATISWQVNGEASTDTYITFPSSGTTVTINGVYVTVDVPGLYTFTIDNAVGPYANGILSYVISGGQNSQGTCVNQGNFDVDDAHCLFNQPLVPWWPSPLCPTDSTGQECGGINGTPRRSTISEGNNGTACQCICNPGYTGAACDVPICSYTCVEGTCTDLGGARGGYCKCITNWVGAACDTPICPACGPNGHCDYSTNPAVPVCKCDSPLWTGTLCDVPICPSAYAGLTCSGHGSCTNGDGITPVCDCTTMGVGWIGTDCNTPDCSYLDSADQPNCNSHGTCSPATNPPTCVCRPQWEGASCDTPKCPTKLLGTNCTGHGTCDGSVDPPVCICDSFQATVEAGWIGSDCGTPVCVGSPQCSNNGACDGTFLSLPPTCACNTPWYGANCSQLPDCPIPSYTNWSSPAFQQQAEMYCNDTRLVSPNLTEACLYDAMIMNSLDPVTTAATASAATCRAQIIAGTRTTPCDPVCPNFCSMHGTCVIDTTGAAVCSCDAGYHGSDCSFQQNDRCLQISWDNGNEIAPINEIYGGGTATDVMNWTPTPNGQQASSTGLENTRSTVVYIYHDYRPQNELCVAFDNTYLMVLNSKASSAYNGQLDYNITFTDSTGFQTPITVQSTALDGGDSVTSSSTATPGQQSITYSVTNKWTPSDNDGISFGYLPQGENFCITFSFDIANSNGIDNFYYATADADGRAQLVPVPLDKLNGLQICSSICNSECGNYTQCTQCTADPKCGWCDQEAYCFEGTPAGPAFGTCGTWRWATDDTTSRVTRTEGFDGVVTPATINVFLGTDDYLPVDLYVNIPSSHPVQVAFLVDLNSQMQPELTSLTQNFDSIFQAVTAAYPNSAFGLFSSIDKPISPYGYASRLDYVVKTHQPLTSDLQSLDTALSNMVVGSGGDSLNAQLEALLYIAENALSVTGYDALIPFRIALIVTDSAFHTPVTGLTPNNLDGVVDATENYPTTDDVQNALIQANIIPIFVSTTQEAQTAYSTLVAGWNLGFAYMAQGTTLTETITGAITNAFSKVQVLPSSSKFIQQVTTDGVTEYSIFPQEYDSVTPLTRVKFTVDLDLSATKRSFSAFDYTSELVVPGYGFVTLNFREGDDRPRAMPVDDIRIVQDTSVTIFFGGASIYVDEENLIFTVLTVPAHGTLYQFANGVAGAAIAVGDAVTDPLHRVIFTPAAGESCSSSTDDYVGTKRGNIGACPYASISYQVSDPCGAASQNVSFNIGVVPTTTNNPPVAYIPSKPSTGQNQDVVIELDGWDKDNDTLTYIITSTTTTGKLYQCLNATDKFTCVKGPEITTLNTPVVLTNPYVVFTPNTNDYGYDYDTFTFQVWDGHNYTQLGYSPITPVCIDVLYTNKPPTTTDLNVTTAENVPILVTLPCLDPDSTTGRAAVCKIDTVPTSGTLYNTDNTQITSSNNYVKSPSGVLTYIPNTDSYGSDSFTYSANDGQASSNTSTVSITVNHVNHLPVVPADYNSNAHTNEDSSVSIPLPQATDEDNDALYYAITKLPTNGQLFFGNETVTLSFYGLAYIPPIPNSYTYIYRPNPNYNGPDSFVFTVNDRVDEINDQRYPIIIDVRPVNDAPVLTVSPSYLDIELNLTGFLTYTQTYTQLSVSDIDAGLNPVTFAIILKNGSTGALKLSLPASILAKPSTTVNSTYINFTTSIPQINSILKNGLQWNVTLDANTTSYPATIYLNVNDNGNVGQVFNPLSDNNTLFINGTGVLLVAESLSAAAQSGNSVSTGAAVGGAAAGAAAVAGIFGLLKKKNALGEVPNPWEEIDMLDAAMTNPLHVEAKTFENNALFENRN